MKAIKSAVIVPIRRDPPNTRLNIPNVPNIKSEAVVEDCPLVNTAEYITIAIASLKIDSPKTIACRF